MTGPRVCGTSSNWPSSGRPRTANLRDTSCCPSASTDTAKVPDASTASWNRDTRSGQNRTRNGSSDTDVKLLAVRAKSSPSRTVVTTVTPVAKRPTTRRYSSASRASVTPSRLPAGRRPQPGGAPRRRTRPRWPARPRAGTPMPTVLPGTTTSPSARRLDSTSVRPTQSTPVSSAPVLPASRDAARPTSTLPTTAMTSETGTSVPPTRKGTRNAPHSASSTVSRRTSAVAQLRSRRVQSSPPSRTRPACQTASARPGWSPRR